MISFEVWHIGHSTFLFIDTILCEDVCLTGAVAEVFNLLAEKAHNSDITLRAMCVNHRLLPFLGHLRFFRDSRRFLDFSGFKVPPMSHLELSNFYSSNKVYLCICPTIAQNKNKTPTIIHRCPVFGGSINIYWHAWQSSRLSGLSGQTPARKSCSSSLVVSNISAYQVPY